jgi:hypothetical protein
MGDQGVQHLADALQKNKVTSITSHLIIQSLFRIDTHHTEPRLQRFW